MVAFDQFYSRLRNSDIPTDNPYLRYFQCRFQYRILHDLPIRQLISNKTFVNTKMEDNLITLPIVSKVNNISALNINLI